MTLTVDAAGAASRGFDLRFVTGSHYNSDILFIMRKPCLHVKIV